MILIILLLGIMIRLLFNKFKLPPLLGFLILGIVIGPFGINKIGLIQNYSGDIRLIALIIILLRAGFGLQKDVLIKYSSISILMGSIPAILEGFFITGISMVLLDFNLAQAGMLGFVLAAVSPAVIVPAMLKLNDLGYLKVPTVILAGASLDDIFAITIFSIFSSLYFTESFTMLSLLSIPISIALGIALGVGVGYISKFFVKHVNAILSAVLLIVISFLLVKGTDLWTLDIAVYLSVMSMAMYINNSGVKGCTKVKNVLDNAWKYFEILLFVLVGALVNPKLAISAGVIGLLIIGFGLMGRVIGVMISLSKSDFTKNEKVFSMLAYTPKATVQAAMGGLPLSMGVVGGDIILAIAVLSIFITAPLGAILIEKSYQGLLSK